MLHQLHTIPRDQPFYLACSGGADSMAITDFYIRGNKTPIIAHFNHGTTQSAEMQSFVESFATTNKHPIEIGNINQFRAKIKDESPEEYWRNARYDWFKSLNQTYPLVMCHHLNDVAETWIFSALHGNPRLIAAKHKTLPIIRPFLTNSKAELLNWCKRFDVKWFEDASNANTHYPRNRIRHNILPQCLEINPGLLKVLKKKIIEQFIS